MANLSISITGLEPLQRIMGVDLGAVLRPAMLAIGQLVKHEIARAPGPVKRPIRWASEKQRRYVMALTREHGPWVRESHSLSQRLIASWTVEAEGADKVVVGTRASYGPWVQSEELQQPMHRETGWRTDAQALDIVVRSGDIERVLGQRIGRALEVD